METIGRAKLAQMLDRGDDFALVEVLDPQQYEAYHLPTAINVPLREDFDDNVQRALPDKRRPIVVYCSNRECSASPTAARKLERMGYEHVLDYADGKEDWRSAGLGVESS